MAMHIPGERQANEDAVTAMVSMLGGITGMVDKGVRLTDLIPILDADPDDDLSGLRLIASRMTYDTGYSPAPVAQVELQVYPEEAKAWLVRTHRAQEVEEGLRLNDDVDHLGKAALMIACGDEPQLMTEAYDQATDNRSPLHPDMVKEIAQLMIDGYSEAPQ